MTTRQKPSQSPLNGPTDPGVDIFPVPSDPDSPIRFSGQQIKVNVDARPLVDAARVVYVTHTSENIANGKRPDGGAQRPLSKARAAEPGRASDNRGHRTGHLSDMIEASPIVGDASHAKCTIRPPGDRAVFINKEKKRGVIYIGESPQIDAEVFKAIDEVVVAMLEGKKPRVEQGTTLAKDEKVS